jgi:ABC-type phosphate transport system ATPase subunit
MPDFCQHILMRSCCCCYCQVGIVGRTGSGKTTLLMALFRMISLAGGRILVDGVDIGNMPLREVRWQDIITALLMVPSPCAWQSLVVWFCVLCSGVR